MSGYALITDYGGREDSEDIGVDFFSDKRALNKHIRNLLTTVSHYNQYNRTICKVIGYVDYSKVKKHGS